VTEAAERYQVLRQSGVHTWLRRYRQEGIAGLQNGSHGVWRASTSFVLAARCRGFTDVPGIG
jgi:hypothetical protein